MAAILARPMASSTLGKPHCALLAPTMLRVLLALLALPLVACGTTIQGTPAPLVAAGAVAGSFVVLQRGPVDAMYSLITGEDCSVLHLERRGEYCRTRGTHRRRRRSAPAPSAKWIAGPNPAPLVPQQAVADTPARPATEPARWFSLF
ncbi:MAG: hypothetical protein RML45_02760 [Acetobacteraceae bacterium]|nr:hypothetical protein [Acetobacteraceae bacterium]